MKRVFLIPNAITAFGLACGLFIIFRISVADPARDLFNLIQASAILLLIAALADLADGAVARWMKAESEFGMQFDSLSDAINFGVTPSLLVLKSLTGGGLFPHRGYSFFVILATMIYSLCGVLRLVRYNISSQKKEKEGSKKHFTGLPIPAAGSAAVSASLVLISPNIHDYFPSLSVNMRSLILGIVLMILGYFMVSRWKFPSIKALHIRVPSFYLIFAVGVLAALMLYGVLDFFAEAYFLLAWLYILIAWSLSIIRKIAGKKSSTLADFEPDHEDENL